MARNTYFSILTIFLLGALPSAAQNMLGLGLNNHSGIHGVYLNPARLANHPQGFSVNLGTVGAHLGNDYAKYRAPFSLLSLATGNVPDDYNNSKGNVAFLPEYLERIQGEEKRSGGLSLEARGPSVLLSLRDGSGISLSTRVRTAFQVSNASSEFVTLVRFGLDNPILWSSGTNYDNKFAINNNSYAELAASYGRGIWESGPHRLSAGATLKYLSGWYSSHLINDGMKYRVTEISGALSGQIQIDQLRGSMGYVGGQKVFDQIGRGKIPTDRPGHGLGADLGLVYEFRPDDSSSRLQRYGSDEADYKLRLGVSLLDLGAISFKRAGVVRNYDLAVDNKRINFKDFKQDQLLNNAFSLIEQRLDLDPQQAGDNFKTGLPTALQLLADWHIRSMFFLSLSGMGNLRAADAIAMWQPSYLAVTPRIERYNGSVAVPLVAIDGALVPGLALRIGPVSIGSDNLPGLFGKKGSIMPRGADIYAGLSFSGVTKAPKRDPDGVYGKSRPATPAPVTSSPQKRRRNPGIEVQYPNDGLARLIERALDSKANGKAWLTPANAALEELVVRLQTNPKWQVAFSFVAAGPNAGKITKREEALVNYLTQQGIPQRQRKIVSAIPPSEDFAGPVRVKIGE